MKLIFSFLIVLLYTNLYFTQSLYWTNWTNTSIKMIGNSYYTEKSNLDTIIINSPIENDLEIKFLFGSDVNLNRDFIITTNRKNMRIKENPLLTGSNSFILILSPSYQQNESGIVFFTSKENNEIIKQIKIKWVSKISNPSIEEKNCYYFVDKCVKECNNQMVNTNNFQQLTSSFTKKGYAVLSAKGTLYQSINFKWGHLTSVNIQKLTFEYSAICLTFAEAYEPRSYYSKFYPAMLLPLEAISNLEPIDINPNDGPFLDPIGTNGCYGIIVKNEKAEECLKMILKINDFHKNKNQSVDINTLIKYEKWENYYLYTYYKDSNGIKQGPYVIKDREGKILVSGNYKDNVKIGEWYDNGKKIILGEIKRGVGGYCLEFSGFN